MASFGGFNPFNHAMPPSTMTQTHNENVIPIELYVEDLHHTHRFINLVPGEPVTIGRASKSKEKSLQSSSANALFESPVVSRNHAELKADLTAPVLDQITIKDLGSMHGTRVNGYRLEEGETMALRSGDELQFGGRVSRGEETHEGVVVLFYRNVPKTTDGSQTLRASQAKPKFEVPENSDDDDDSDYPSEPSIHVMSDDESPKHGSSSARTTPEQNKSLLGSSQQPIDVDAPRPVGPPFVLNLEDDGPSASNHNAVNVIQDSVDKDIDIYNPSSLRQVLNGQCRKGQTASADYLGLAPILSESFGHKSDSKSDNDSGSEAEMELTEDELEPESSDGEQEAFYYNGPFSDADHNSVIEEEEEPELYSSKKAPSPELGTQDFATAPRSQTTWTSPPQDISQTGSFTTPGYSFTPYDPVRSSQGGQGQQSSSLHGKGPGGLGYSKYGPAYGYTLPLPPNRYYDLVPNAGNVEPQGYSYTPARLFPAPSPPAGSHTLTRLNMSGSQVPTSQIPTYNVPPPALYPVRSPSMQDAGGDEEFRQSRPASCAPHSPAIPPVESLEPFKGLDYIPAGRILDPIPPIEGPKHNVDMPRDPLDLALAESLNKELVAPNVSTPNNETYGKGEELVKNKIGTPDLLEADAVPIWASRRAELKKRKEARRDKKMDEKSKKRKLEETLHTAEGTAAALEESVTMAGEFALSLSQERPKKKQKAHATAGTGRLGLGEVAKYAGGAAICSVLGGAATMAFLCSPLAERALEWLA